MRRMDEIIDLRAQRQALRERVAELKADLERSHRKWRTADADCRTLEQRLKTAEAHIEKQNELLREAEREREALERIACEPYDTITRRVARKALAGPEEEQDPTTPSPPKVVRATGRVVRKEQRPSLALCTCSMGALNDPCPVHSFHEEEA